jgi:2-hydroxychromene-2-carboxylate isomerase
VKVSWVFDVVSPFSYLSLQQLSRLPQATSIEYVPVLFAGLLDHFGQLGPAEITSKRKFTYRFLLWRARKMGIAMRMPPAHPFNPLSALRLIIAAGCDRRAVETVIDAVYRDGQDMTESDVIARLAQQLDITDPQAALTAPAVKQRLRDNTDWAISHGVFGVPSFVIGEQVFWGHDSFDMVLDYLRDPATFDDAQMRAADTLPIGVARAKASDPTPRA